MLLAVFGPRGHLWVIDRANACEVAFVILGIYQLPTGTYFLAVNTGTTHDAVCCTLFVDVQSLTQSTTTAIASRYCTALYCEASTIHPMMNYCFQYVYTYRLSMWCRIIRSVNPGFVAPGDFTVYETADRIKEQRVAHTGWSHVNCIQLPVRT